MNNTKIVFIYEYIFTGRYVFQLAKLYFNWNYILCAEKYNYIGYNCTSN